MPQPAIYSQSSLRQTREKKREKDANNDVHCENIHLLESTCLLVCPRKAHEAAGTGI